MRYGDTGVLIHDADRATAGYTVFSALRGFFVYLIDMAGEVVHRWELPQPLSGHLQVLPNGHLLVAHRTKDGPPMIEGKGGRLVELDWDGNVVWSHEDPFQHHDLRRLPNGNTLYIAWDPLSAEEAARVQGGLPGTEAKGVIYGDMLREVDPSGNIVWEWRFADQPIEDHPLCPLCFRNEFAHANSCHPMADGNVLMSFRRINTLAIVERATGDLIWQQRDNSWGHQHDPRKLDNGNILFFSNGVHITPAQPFSRVIEMNPETGETVWEYRGKPRWTFFSDITSSAQRLASGNTVICEGRWGRIFELAPDGEIVWEYVSPHFIDEPQLGRMNSIFSATRLFPDGPALAGRI